MKRVEEKKIVFVKPSQILLRVKFSIVKTCTTMVFAVLQSSLFQKRCLANLSTILMF